MYYCQRKPNRTTEKQGTIMFLSMVSLIPGIHPCRCYSKDFVIIMDCWHQHLSNISATTSSSSRQYQKKLQQQYYCSKDLNTVSRGVGNNDLSLAIQTDPIGVSKSCVGVPLHSQMAYQDTTRGEDRDTV